MKTRLLAKRCHHHNMPPRPRRISVWLLGSAVAALTAMSPCLAAKVLFHEDFEDVSDWRPDLSPSPGYGSWSLVNGQAIMRLSRLEATDPDDYVDWHANSNPLTRFRLGANPLELRVDLVSANQDDVFTLLGITPWLPGPVGYWVGRDQDEIFFCKYGYEPEWFVAWIFTESLVLTNQNTALSVAFTLQGGDLAIRTQILDRDHAYAALWEKTVTDTTGVDPSLPNRHWKGLKMDPERYPKVLTGDVAILLAIFYGNSQAKPAQFPEITLDNFTVLQYPAPVLDEQHSVLLAWPEGTAEEMVAVSADSVEGPYDKLCPEPIYKRFGNVSLAVPITATRQFFTLAPGTQFSDDFDPPKPPFSGKDNWVPWFYDEADATRWSVSPSNGVLRVQTLATPADHDGRLAIAPPGPVLRVVDFCASVDVLSLTVNDTDGLAGIAARGVWDPETGWPGNVKSYIGSVVPNSDGVNQARLNFFPGSWPPVRGKVFAFKPGTPYRLIFSGLGQRFTIELIDLKTGQAAVEPLEVTNSTFSQGHLGLFLQTGRPTTFDATLDNFFVTGTKPGSP
ncbi:MAG: hypothetical protein AB9869_08935 [Verrucomicrobiia bacterium]